MITTFYFIACSAFSVSALSTVNQWVAGQGTVQCVCIWETSLCGSWLYWLHVLPSRAWFNAAFCECRTELVTDSSFSPSLSFSPSHSHISLFVSLTCFLPIHQFLLLRRLSRSYSPLPLVFLSVSLYLTATAYHSWPLLRSLFLFLFIAATYISTLLSFTLLAAPLTPPPPLLKICPSFSISNPILSYLLPLFLSYTHTHLSEKYICI